MQRIGLCQSLIGGHLRPRPHFPLYFLMRLVLAPQTREPTAAPLNLMACALPKPIGSGSAMIWWCRWPTHGGRGLKPVESRVAWLMLVVVYCCQHKKPCRSTLSYCRQDYVCRGFSKDKKELGSLLPIVHPLSFSLSHPPIFASSQFFHLLTVVGEYCSSCDQLILLCHQKPCISRLTQP